MGNPNYPKGDQPIVTNGKVLYFGPIDRSKDVDIILQKCEETGGTGLVVEDNTIYEIDCECYTQMLKRKEKKNQCVNPFQS